MAQVVPAGWRELKATGGAAREIETLELLEEGLSDRYTVYHGVHWTRLGQRGYALHGEIDFAIVSSVGHVVLIEQKAGSLIEHGEQLYKRYAEGDKDVVSQLARNTENLRNRLRNECGAAMPPFEALFYCPDHRLRGGAVAGLERARIIDAPRRGELVQRIQALLPIHDEPLPSTPKVHAFFADLLELVPDVQALVGQVGALQTRLSGGLAEWARRIECEPFRLRVIGTAGSGKTQLALAVFRDAVAAGKRPLYVCFNRPLADHFARIAPAGGEVTTYHQLADRIARARGQAPDFASPGAFEHLARVLDAHAPDEPDRFDELIVDEGQDFEAGWADNLMRFLRPGGRAWWLEDPMQNLYGRPPVPLPGWVTLRSDVNYRSPADVIHMLNRLLPLQGAMRGGSPLTGSNYTLVTYTDGADLLARTRAAIDECMQLRFRHADMAVVTYRGRQGSKFTPFDQLGRHRLRSPTGGYDLLGNAVYTDGSLLLDSVMRFKGQSAPCVIFTEIDFEALDDGAVRRLFVGATRATVKLVLVISERAAGVLLERLRREPAPIR